VRTAAFIQVRCITVGTGFACRLQSARRRVALHFTIIAAATFQDMVQLIRTTVLDMRQATDALWIITSKTDFVIRIEYQL
jgi:hypothetical protein